VEVMPVQIKWLGHACFLLTDQDGIKVLTDPFNEGVGYPLPEVEADIVTVSHDHFDHNAVSILPGKPEVVRGPDGHKIGNLTFKGIVTFHDDAGGRERGENTVFVIEMDGLKVCHLGDLGHHLERKQVEEIGSPDLLMVPVGGTFTIDAKGAKQIVEDLKPRLVIPMHYRTEVVKLPIKPVEEFTALFQNVIKTKVLEVSPDTLPADIRVVVLELS